MSDKLPLVEVEWLDAASYGNWSTPAEHRKHHPVPCRTAGYLLERNARHIIVVQSIGESTGNVCDSIAIPAGWVKRIRRLKR